MALTAEQKIGLVAELAVKKNFNSNYSELNQFWFLFHMIKYYASIGTADTDIKGKIVDFMKDCKRVADEKMDFEIGIKFSKTVLKTNQKRRIEIIYGVLGITPDMVLPGNDKLLEFIIKRRFRAVMRMDFYVNPNFQGYFRYLDKCLGKLDFQVNSTADDFWEKYSVYPPKPNLGSCFRLNSAGKVDPATSVKSLFKPDKNACTGNLMDCARVLAIVYLDFVGRHLLQKIKLDRRYH